MPFPNDDADALSILLRSHRSLGMATDTGVFIPFDHLADLTALCDKYDRIHLVRPWLASWQIQPRGDHSRTRGMALRSLDGWRLRFVRDTCQKLVFVLQDRRRRQV